MKINLCFQGWLRGAELEYVFNSDTGEQIELENVSVDVVVDRLTSGVWCMSLHDVLDNADDSEIELHDYEATK